MSTTSEARILDQRADEQAAVLPFPRAADSQASLLVVLKDIADSQRQIAESLRRLADAQAPAPKDKVGSPYVADRLGCTTVYVAQMAREGTIPESCVVPGTGGGKVWKFYRERINKWIESR